MSNLFKVGVEKLARNPQISSKWGRCALMCNQASVTKTLEPAWAVCRDVLGEKLVAFFGPQHGFESAVQDNMIETPHAVHGPTGLPIHSLYSETREPTAEMLRGIETLIVDIQVVGCRVYTYKYTIAGMLRAAKKHGLRVVVLDRPNPVGGLSIEGRVLEMDARSFVGEFPIPMRHGLTAGEAAQLFNADIGADLEVVSLEGWDPKMQWGDLGREWVLTSPNLPTPQSMYTFPGTVVFEGTNISEGRGTTLPFQFIGAPYIKDARAYVGAVKEILGGEPAGILLRPAEFQPTSQKWAGELCRGVQIHVMDPHPFRSMALGTALLRAGLEMGGDRFAWKQPPYEYDRVTLPIKLIYGSHAIVEKLTAREFDLRDPYWNAGCEEYVNRVEPYLLYPRKMQVLPQREG